jgi:inorganic pyrophosphatase
VVVEAPRGSRIKRRPDGSFDYASPLPLPWNYGHVAGEQGGDGDPLDALLLGPRRPAGHEQVAPVVAVVEFVDAGREDLKLVCGTPSALDLLGIRAFFAVFTPAKRGLQRLRGERGWTGVRAVHVAPTAG